MQDQQIPSFEMPAFDGIGANEYIVDVTHPNTVDFISTVDTPTVAELSIWYHTLNVGFRPRISGETDFPCIYDGRVGIGRTYAQIDGGLTFAGWLNGLRSGRSYVSDGKSHLLDLRVDDAQVGRGNSELRMSAPRTVKAQLRAAAYLDPLPNEGIRSRPPDQQPYWDVVHPSPSGDSGMPLGDVLDAISRVKDVAGVLTVREIVATVKCDRRARDGTTQRVLRSVHWQNLDAG